MIGLDRFDRTLRLTTHWNFLVLVSSSFARGAASVEVVHGEALARQAEAWLTVPLDGRETAQRRTDSSGFA